jgi:type IV pilus assembly protein PilW
MDINAIRRNCRSAAMTSHSRGSDGFTLIEVLIVLTMSMILMGAVVSTMASLQRSYTTQEVAADTQQDVRMAMVLMTRDIKQAGLDPIGTANAGFERADSSYIRITSDRILAGDDEANGEIDDAGFERVSYFRDPSDNTLQIRLYEGSTGSEATHELARNITNLQLTYFDADGATTTDLNEIRSVGIDLTARAPAGLDGDVERSYTTRVRCRNMSLP